MGFGVAVQLGAVGEGAPTFLIPYAGDERKGDQREGFHGPFLCLREMLLDGIGWIIPERYINHATELR